MATYIILSNFTDQGIRTVKDTTKRSEAVRKAAKKFGATAKEIYWTLGACDVVAIFEAPDDETITGLALSLGSGGNVRTQVLRAFDKAQMDEILKKMA